MDEHNWAAELSQVSAVFAMIQFSIWWFKIRTSCSSSKANSCWLPPACISSWSLLQLSVKMHQSWSRLQFWRNIWQNRILLQLSTSISHQVREKCIQSKAVNEPEILVARRDRIRKPHRILVHWSGKIDKVRSQRILGHFHQSGCCRTWPTDFPSRLVATSSLQSLLFLL